jgi:hypothetical protein
VGEQCFSGGFRVLGDGVLGFSGDEVQGPQYRCDDVGRVMGSRPQGWGS